MTNTARFTVADLAACFGQAAAHLPSDLVVEGVSTDTRTLVAGNVFVALRGERFDGHDHLEAAIERGASLLIVETIGQPPTANGQPPTAICQVPDTLHALGTLAWFHRRRFQIPVIAIGGSAGKTSTKELTAHVLSQAYTVLKTQANYNNRIGTPHTLLQLTDAHTTAVIEIGTNEPGEMETLTAMVQPTHGLLTQIGKEHLEKLIDLDGVEREETALFDYLRDHDGLMLINANDQRLSAWYARNGGRGLSFGVDTEADVNASVSFDAELHPTIHVVLPDTALRATLQTTGYAAALNAVAALAVGIALGLDAHQLKHGLASYEPPPSHGYARMEVQRAGPLTILNDTYNANPASMRMALRTLAMYPATRRIAVLGDMRELGAAAREEHQEILSLALQTADVVLLYGQEFAGVVGEKGLVFASHEEIVDRLKEIAREGDVVLVKGSRGMELEKVVEELQHLE
jgi:UDP-N-acetylmuramoyl-tripeptide--D-alanyl-D-alanine ligase